MLFIALKYYALWYWLNLYFIEGQVYMINADMWCGLIQIDNGGVFLLK